MQNFRSRLHWSTASALFSLVLAVGCGDSDPDPGTDAAIVDGGQTTNDGGQIGADGSVIVPGCGDGVLATTEACEGFDLRGETCSSQGFTSGRLSCTTTCTLDTSACVRCGDDTIGEGEVCDGTALGGATCMGLLGDGYTGTVSCAEDCLGHVTDGCTLALPPSELAPCDRTTSSTCAASLSCLSTAQGDFCLEACTAGNVGDCAAEDVCLDVGPPRSPTYACVPRPGAGDTCTNNTGCSEGSCEATFSESGNTVSVCAEKCTIAARNLAQGTCAAGYSCAENPAGFYEEEPGAITCTEATVTRDCDVATGFECLVVGMDATGGPLRRCARYTRQCVTPQSFFGFADTAVPDGARCDLAGPTEGGRYCGLLGSVTLNPARVRCFPIFDGIDSVGACVGFCDPLLSTDGMTDLSCGSAATCQIPDAPQFFYPQSPAVFCSAGTPAVCDGAAGFDRCVDFGQSPQCAKPSKVCVPVGG